LRFACLAVSKCPVQCPAEWGSAQCNACLPGSSCSRSLCSLCSACTNYTLLPVLVIVHESC
jgi:hypothetical protein